MTDRPRAMQTCVSSRTGNRSLPYALTGSVALLMLLLPILFATGCDLRWCFAGYGDGCAQAPDPASKYYGELKSGYGGVGFRCLVEREVTAQLRGDPPDPLGCTNEYGCFDNLHAPPPLQLDPVGNVESGFVERTLAGYPIAGCANIVVDACIPWNVTVDEVDVAGVHRNVTYNVLDWAKYSSDTSKWPAALADAVAAACVRASKVAYCKDTFGCGANSPCSNGQTLEECRVGTTGAGRCGGRGTTNYVEGGYCHVVTLPRPDCDSCLNGYDPSYPTVPPWCREWTQVFKQGLIPVAATKPLLFDNPKNPSSPLIGICATHTTWDDIVSTKYNYMETVSVAKIGPRLSGFGEVDASQSAISVQVTTPDGSVSGSTAVSGSILVKVSEAGCDAAAATCPATIESLVLTLQPFTIGEQPVGPVTLINEGEVVGVAGDAGSLTIMAGTLKVTMQTEVNGFGDVEGPFINFLPVMLTWRPEMNSFDGTIAFTTTDGTTQVDVAGRIAGTFTNRSPVAVPGGNQSLECTGVDTTQATLDGRASHDIDGTPVEYDWQVASTAWEGASFSRDASPQTPPLDVGEHTFFLRVRDPWGWIDQENTTVTVLDTTPPTVTCPETERAVADATTCRGNAPDLIARSEASDLCTRTADIAMTQDPPPRGELPMGEHVIDVTATDTHGNSTVCSTIVTVSLPVGKDPAVLRFVDAKLVGDYLGVHGTLAPCEPLDASANEIEIQLTNANGVIYQVVLPAGALRHKGNHFSYRNRDAQVTRDGIRRLDVVYRPHRNRYQLRLQTYGDMTLATEASMTLQIRIGTNFFANTSDWAQTATGWRLSLPGEQ